MSPAALERRLFEVLGGWVPSTPEPEAKLLFRIHSFQHAAHAELWDSVGGDVPEAPWLAQAVEDMARAGERTVDRLAACRETLHRVIAVYSAAGLEAEQSASGPRARALTLMIRDDIAAAEEAERVRMTLTGGEADADSP